MALIPPFYLDCVVALGNEDVRGDMQWYASGLLYGQFLPTPDKSAVRKSYAVYLVTNRHVVEDLRKVVVRFNPQGNEAAREYEVALTDDNGAPLWTAHPNKSIDIAVIPVNFHLLKHHAMQVMFFESDTHVLTTSKMRRNGVTEGDFAYVLGFPMGLIGGKRNSVIVRSGTLARIRDTLAGHTHEFLLDTFAFPGNSGGPVILKPEAMAIQGTQAHTEAYLIGIVSSYVPYQEVAISEQTQHPRVVFEENSGLAAAIPMDYVQQAIRSHLKGLKLADPRTHKGRRADDSPRLR